MKKITVDVERLVKELREHERMIIMFSEEYIESIRDPNDDEHIALNAQLQIASEGNHDTYILWLGKDRRNLPFLLELIEGAKLKAIIFVDKDDEEDMEMGSMFLRLVMGPTKMGKTSKDYIRT